MGNVQESFPDYTVFICKFKTDAFYSWKVFSLQVGDI